MTKGYKSSDKREAVEYIRNVSRQAVVSTAAERALSGKASLDSALVTARESGRQGVVVDTANHALGMPKK